VVEETTFEKDEDAPEQDLFQPEDTIGNVTTLQNPDGSFTKATEIIHPDGSKSVVEETTFGQDEETQVVNQDVPPQQAADNRSINTTDSAAQPPDVQGASQQQLPIETVTTVQNQDGTFTTTTETIHPDGTKSIVEEITSENAAAEGGREPDPMTLAVGPALFENPVSVRSSGDQTSTIETTTIKPDGSTIVESILPGGRRSIVMTTPFGDVHETIEDAMIQL